MLNTGRLDYIFFDHFQFQLSENNRLMYQHNKIGQFHQISVWFGFENEKKNLNGSICDQVLVFSYKCVKIFSINFRSIILTGQSSIISPNVLRKKRSPNEFNQSAKTICERFSEPLPNNTFFSPINTTMLNENYPPGVDCILIISGK